MKLRDLPGYSRLYLDFIDHSGPFTGVISVRPGRQALLGRLPGLAGRKGRPIDSNMLAAMSQASDSDATRENVRRLGRPGTVAVVAHIRPGIYGGPMSRLLQCLTAIRLAEVLENELCPAVPLLWIGASAGPDPDVAVLDNDSQLAQLSNLSLDELRSKYPSNISETDTWSVISSSLHPDRAGSEATADLYRGLLADHGVVVLNPAILDLRAFLPERIRALGETAVRARHVLGGADIAAGCASIEQVSAFGVSDPILAHVLFSVAAFVVSSEDICTVGHLLPLFSEAGLEEPLLWPSLSVTLLDVRSRKILEKYGLELRDTFGGSGDLLARIEQDADGAGTLGAFDLLLADIDSRLNTLTTLVPQGDSLAAAIFDARSKMHYQVQKLRERYESSLGMKLDAAARQIGRLCNSLAPEGKRQEQGLAAIHFVLRYSRAVLGEILRKADPWDFQHQLISLD